MIFISLTNNSFILISLIQAIINDFFFFSTFIFRVVAKESGSKTICGYKFQNFGAHSDSYPCGYLTAAASIGMIKDDVDTFINRLDKVLTKFQNSRPSPEGASEKNLKPPSEETLI